MAYKKIAFIPPHRLGDTLFTTPGIRYLKEQLPDCEISIAAPSTLAHEVFRNNPSISSNFDCTSGVPQQLLETHFDIILGDLGNLLTLEIANQQRCGLANQCTGSTSKRYIHRASYRL